METIVGQVDIGFHPNAAYVAIAAVALSSVSLALLHILNPEFSPSWRMVSEYANGNRPWLLTVVFMGCAISSFALAAAIWPVWTTTLGKVGLALLIIGGVGQMMGGLFDINHKLHGPAAMIGIPSICVAAIILTIALGSRSGIDAPPMWSALLPAISIVLMAGAFMLFFSALKAAGVDVSGQTEPLKELPEGVTSFVGWANRLFFVGNYIWVALASIAVVKASV